MRKISMSALTLGIVIYHHTAYAENRVMEGVIESSELITTSVGKDGRPLLGAAAGVGVGSLFGSGSGKDAAKVAGGILGAARQAKRKKQQFFGWRYIVKTGDSLHAVDVWCATPNNRCSGIDSGNAVYIVDKNYIEVK